MALDNVIQIIIRARDESAKAFQAALGNMGAMNAQNKTLSASSARLAQDVGLVPPQITQAARAIQNFKDSITPSVVETSRLAQEFPKLASSGVATAAGLAQIGAAAERTNVSFGTVSSGLLAFKTNLSGAQKGSGAAFDALTKLGFSAQQIGTGFGGAQQALVAVSEKLGKVENAALKAEVGAALFGKSFSGMAPVLGSFGAAADTAAASTAALNAALFAVVGVVVVVTASLAALGAIIRTSIDAAKLADELGDLGDKLGLTTEEVSRLSFAASQSDTSIGAIATSMRFLSRNLVEARKEGSEARETFSALGFSANEIDGGLTNAKEALLRLADAVSSTSDPMEKTAIATKLLGRSADELIPFLNRGRDGIEELMQMSDELGATISSTASKIGDDFTKAVLRLHFAMAGLKTQLAVEVVPTLTELVNTLTQAVVQMRAVAAAPKNIFDGLKESAEKAIPGLKDVLAVLNAINLAGKTASQIVAAGGVGGARGKGIVESSFGGVTTGSSSSAFPPSLIGPPDLRRRPPTQRFSESDQSFKDRTAAYEKETQAIEAAAEKARLAIESVTKKAKEEAEAIRIFIQTARLDPSIFVRDAGKAQREAIEKQITETELKISIELDPAKVAEMHRQIDELRRQAEAANGLIHVRPDQKSLSDSIPGLEPEVGPVFDPAAASAERLGEALSFAGLNLEQLTDSLVEAQVSFDSVLGTVVALGEAMNVAFKAEFDPLLRGIADAQRAVQDFANDAIGALDDSLRGFLFEGQKGFKSFGDLLGKIGEIMAQLIQDVIVLTIRTIALKAITSALGGVGGLLGAIFSEGGTVTDSPTGGGSGPYQAKAGGTVPDAAPSYVAGGSVPPIVIHLAGGGAAPLPHFASGGAVTIPEPERRGGYHVRAAFQALAEGGPVYRNVSQEIVRSMPHFAGGGGWSRAFSGLVPGAAARHDSVLAGLAPGEYVLPLSHRGQSPGEVVTKLASYTELIEKQSREAPITGGGESPLIGQMVVQAWDADSITNQSRPGGRMYEALERASELGR